MLHYATRMMTTMVFRTGPQSQTLQEVNQLMFTEGCLCVLKWTGEDIITSKKPLR